MLERRSGDPANGLYDQLAQHYHLMFENWDASIARQAPAIAAILEREGAIAPGAAILDCACGIGTQSIGLAKLGFRITGSDMSAEAVKRAQSEAAARNLSASFIVADMRRLEPLPDAAFDAVICMDNALPHLLSDEDLAQAVRQIHAKLRPGGTFIASIRDYDKLIRERPTVQGPAFFTEDGRRRIVFQLWDWHDERRYTFHLYITRQTHDGWTNFHSTAVYRAVLRDEIAAILGPCGFTEIHWQFPAEGGFYQPVVIAKAAA